MQRLVEARATELSDLHRVSVGSGSRMASTATAPTARRRRPRTSVSAAVCRRTPTERLAGVNAALGTQNSLTKRRLGDVFNSSRPRRAHRHAAGLWRDRHAAKRSSSPDVESRASFSLGGEGPEASPSCTRLHDFLSRAPDGRASRTWTERDRTSGADGLTRPQATEVSDAFFLSIELRRRLPRLPLLQGSFGELKKNPCRQLPKTDDDAARRRNVIVGGGDWGAL